MRGITMVTKEDVDKANAAAYAATYAAAAEDSEAFLLNGQLLDDAVVAWDNYIKLKREFENDH
jgi:hypothetical protein